MFFYYARRNAECRGSGRIEIMDVILAFKQAKHGYESLDVPPNVASVYDYVFDRKKRLSVFENIVSEYILSTM